MRLPSGWLDTGYSCGNVMIRFRSWLGMTIWHCVSLFRTNTPYSGLIITPLAYVLPGIWTFFGTSGAQFAMIVCLRQRPVVLNPYAEVGLIPRPDKATSIIWVELLWRTTNLVCTGFSVKFIGRLDCGSVNIGVFRVSVVTNGMSNAAQRSALPIYLENYLLVGCRE